MRNAILYGVVCVEMGMITKRIGGRGRGLVQVQVQVQVAHAICPYTKRSYCPLYERVRVILINQSFDDVSDVLPRQAFFNVLYVRVRNCRSTVLRYSAGTTSTCSTLPLSYSTLLYSCTILAQSPSRQSVSSIHQTVHGTICVENCSIHLVAYCTRRHCGLSAPHLPNEPVKLGLYSILYI